MTEQRGKGEPRGRKRRPERRPEPAAPRWASDTEPKVCRKCGGRMFPADWIWQKYGLCVGWRCAKCKDKVMARSMPFKGLRKRTLDPDEAADLSREAPAEDRPAETTEQRPPQAARPRRTVRGRR